MDDKKKKRIFISLVALAIIILLGVGSTFAYFTATVTSNESAVSLGAAVYELSLKDDTTLQKNQLIPSLEKYVDIASTRVDENGDFLRPYEENGKKVTDGTVCIDDNLNEICSIYTFTVQNPMTDMELPLYIQIIPSINTFENLYFKVLDEDKQIVMEATHIYDNRPFELDSNGNKVYEEGSKMANVPLNGLNVTLEKAPDEETPSEITFSIVFWIMETGEDQTPGDSNQMFAGTLSVNASGADGNGITGIFSATGTE